MKQVCYMFELWWQILSKYYSTEILKNNIGESKINFHTKRLQNHIWKQNHFFIPQFYSPALISFYRATRLILWNPMNWIFIDQFPEFTDFNSSNFYLYWIMMFGGARYSSGRYQYWRSINKEFLYYQNNIFLKFQVSGWGFRNYFIYDNLLFYVRYLIGYYFSTLENIWIFLCYYNISLFL